MTDPCLLLNDLWLLSSIIFSLVSVMNLKLQVANNPAGSTATKTIVHRSISSYMGWSCELAIHARVPLLHLPSCTPCHANFLLDSLVEIPCMFKYAFIFCLWCCPHCYNESYNKKRAAFTKAALKHCKNVSSTAYWRVKSGKPTSKLYSSYGLRKSPHASFSRFNQPMLNSGYCRSHSDRTFSLEK